MHLDHFSGSNRKCKLLKIYAITQHNVLIINKNKKRTDLFYFSYLFFCSFVMLSLFLLIALYGVCTLSKGTQNIIKILLRFGYSYSTFIKRILGVQKSTICEDKRKFFPNMVSSLSN